MGEQLISAFFIDGEEYRGISVYDPDEAGTTIPDTEHVHYTDLKMNPDYEFTAKVRMSKRMVNFIAYGWRAKGPCRKRLIVRLRRNRHWMGLEATPWEK